MRYARTLAVAGLATAALFATTGSASAAIVDVKTASFNCPSGYRELLRVGNTLVCYDTNVPRYRVITDGADCPTGYTEYSVLDHYRICIDT